jgi:hypothetical protein
MSVVVLLARASGHYVCGESLVAIFGLGSILLGLHTVAGRILGLEEQKRRPFGPDGAAGQSDSAG